MKIRLLKVLLSYQSKHKGEAGAKLSLIRIVLVKSANLSGSLTPVWIIIIILLCNNCRLFLNHHPAEGEVAWLLCVCLLLLGKCVLPVVLTDWVSFAG